MEDIANKINQINETLCVIEDSELERFDIDHSKDLEILNQMIDKFVRSVNSYRKSKTKCYRTQMENARVKKTMKLIVPYYCAIYDTLADDCTLEDTKSVVNR